MSNYTAPYLRGVPGGAIEALMVAQRMVDAEKQMRSDRALLRVLVGGDYMLAGVSQWGVLTHFHDQTRIVLDPNTSIRVSSVDVVDGIHFYFQRDPEGVPMVAIVYGKVTEVTLDAGWPG